MIILRIMIALSLPAAWFVTLAHAWLTSPKAVGDCLVALFSIIGGVFLSIFWVGIWVPDIGNHQIGGFRVWAIGLVGMFAICVLGWPIASWKRPSDRR